ncbi:hypothetical protein TRAPUB_8756 [Trametes pubescens]|uniref:Uncharacterized protein n=1 Tax=Trametes pubescens TaxID=154538 RepID=A0A1M2W4I7_TRAPU|nr:hypothetical protein TRAPUB_8756 [Trametes pubescens]
MSFPKKCLHPSVLCSMGQILCHYPPYELGTSRVRASLLPHMIISRLSSLDTMCVPAYGGRGLAGRSECPFRRSKLAWTCSLFPHASYSNSGRQECILVAPREITMPLRVVFHAQKTARSSSSTKELRFLEFSHQARNPLGQGVPRWVRTHTRFALCEHDAPSSAIPTSHRIPSPADGVYVAWRAGGPDDPVYLVYITLSLYWSLLCPPFM